MIAFFNLNNYKIYTILLFSYRILKECSTLPVSHQRSRSYLQTAKNAKNRI